MKCLKINRKYSSVMGERVSVCVRVIVWASYYYIFSHCHFNSYMHTYIHRLYFSFRCEILLCWNCFYAFSHLNTLKPSSFQWCRLCSTYTIHIIHKIAKQNKQSEMAVTICENRGESTLRMAKNCCTAIAILSHSLSSAFFGLMILDKYTQIITICRKYLNLQPNRNWQNG